MATQHLLLRTLAAAAAIAAAIGFVAGCSSGISGPSATTTVSKSGSAKESGPLPLDPAVQAGVLPNGLTYYVRENGRPEARAELRLVLDAGSVLEDDDQLGLAHFVEHMAFNGTERFEKLELVDYLESIGMRFGPDINAYTSFDETVYMLQVPTDSAALLHDGLQILKEWASAVAFDSLEIEKERGVVIEEWRTRRGAQSRISDKQLPVLLKDSRYAVRLPIGDPEILAGFDHETLKRFYGDWYRPDLMAVVAVGDFDADEITRAIQELFGTLVNPHRSRFRTEFAVAPHEETLFAPATDPEAPYSSIAMVYKHPRRDFMTREEYRRYLVEALYDGMFGERLAELTQSTDPPFAFAGAGTASFARTSTFYILNAVANDREIPRALDVILTEAERVRRHGFLESELDRERRSLLRGYERAYNERDKTESSVLAAEYVDHFLQDVPAPGIEYEYDFAREAIPGIKIEEVNALARQWVVDHNRVVMYSAPERPGAGLPSKDSLQQIIGNVAEADLEPYREDVSDEALITRPLSPGLIVEEKFIDENRLHVWELANGARVIIKQTDFKNDEIRFAAYSPGGTSLVPDEFDTAGDYAARIIGQSGIARFGPVELAKKLAGRVVNVNPYISETSEGFGGSAAPEDFETLLQLVHLYFTEPRADSVAFESFRKRIGDLMSTMRVSPERAFRDTLAVTLSQHHPRRRPLSEGVLAEMDLLRSYSIFRDRIADASDFTFFFVGNVDLEAARPLITTYLGSIPDIDRTEFWRDLGIRPPDGVVQRTVRRGLEEKSSVRLVFTGSADWSQEARRAMYALREILRIRLRESLREDLGGTYGVSVSGSVVRDPEPSYRLSIGFGCDPARVDELTRTVFEELAMIRADGPTEGQLEKVREIYTREHEVALRQNGWWLGELLYAVRHGEDLAGVGKGEHEHLARLAPLDIAHAAEKFADPNRYVRVVLLPAGEE